MKPDDASGRLALGERPLRVLLPAGSGRRQYNCRDLHLRSLFGRRGEEAIALLSRAERGIPEGEEESEEEARLGAHERVVLARNDALEEVERGAREDAAGSLGRTVPRQWTRGC